jgi:hypothetical protein
MMMATKEIATSVAAGAILGLSGAFFAFQGRISRLETTVEQLRSGPSSLQSDSAPLQLQRAFVAPPATSDLAAARPGNIVLGPVDATLHASPRRQNLTAWYAGVNLRDFMAQVRFYNPADPRTARWSVGMAFRDAGPNNEFRLIISSDQQWWLQHVTPASDSTANIKELARGRLSSMDVSPGASNLLTLKVKGFQGVLSLNDRAVSTLPLSIRDTSGDLAVLAFVQPADDLLTARFEGLTIWDLP